AGLVELVGGGETGRPGADNGDALAGALGGRLRLDPAFLVRLVDDRALDRLDGDRRLADAEHARTLARRRAAAAGELREVVGLVQPFQRFLPEAAIDQVVPLRDEVVDRAAGGHAADERAGMAERHAAIHAAGALFLEHVLAGMLVEFLPV